MSDSLCVFDQCSAPSQEENGLAEGFGSMQSPALPAWTGRGATGAGSRRHCMISREGSWSMRQYVVLISVLVILLTIGGLVTWPQGLTSAQPAGE